MVRKILFLDFVMTKWFVGKKKNGRIVSASAYFFLSKIIFLGSIIIVFILKLIGIKEPLLNVAGVIVYGIMVILIVADPIEKMVKSPSFEKDYKSLSRVQIYKKRALALFIYIVSFYFMMIALIMINRITL